MSGSLTPLISFSKAFIANFKVLINKILEFWKNEQILGFPNNQDKIFICQKIVNKTLKMGFNFFLDSYCEPPYCIVSVVIKSWGKNNQIQSQIVLLLLFLKKIQ
jgi:hypothetical protein